MALIKCPECKNEVSDSAKACPKCGYPIKQETIYDRDEQSVRDGKNYAKGQYLFELPYKIGCFIAIMIFAIIFFIVFIIKIHGWVS